MSVELHVGEKHVISELAKAASDLTFGQLARDDAVEEKKGFRRIPQLAAEIKRSIAAPVGKVLRRLIIIRIAVAEIETKSLFDSNANLHLVSSHLCSHLPLDVIETVRKITIANGHKSGVTGIVKDVPINLGSDVVASNDCLVIENFPFNLINGQPAIEALQALINLSKQQFQLAVGAKNIVLPFEY